MRLVDLSDERRNQKPWLPQNDGRDVSDGLVYMDDFTAGRYPACWRHGAIARVSLTPALYRCQEMRCGVGAELIA
jgi:hypothetical protein